MPFQPANPFNIAGHFLDDRVREGLGDRIALRTANGTVTYAALQARANRFANALAEMGVRPEERVLVGLPDVPDFPAALFGALKRGAVGVMVNCFLGEARLRELYDYTRASAVVVDAEHAGVFTRATRGAHHVPASSSSAPARATIGLTTPVYTMSTMHHISTTPLSGSSPAAPPAAPRA